MEQNALVRHKHAKIVISTLDCVNRKKNIYLRVECRDENEHLHKLTAKDEGLYAIIKLEGKTVVIQQKDKTAERVNRDHLTTAPTPRIAKYIQHKTRPMNAEELMSNTFPTSKPVNGRDITTPKQLPAQTMTCNQSPQREDGVHSTKAQQPNNLQPVLLQEQKTRKNSSWTATSVMERKKI